MSDDIKTVEVEDAPVITLDSGPIPGEAKPDDAGSEKATDDDASQAEGMAAALAKFGLPGEAKEESPAPAERPRDEKGKFVKKEEGAAKPAEEVKEEKAEPQEGELDEDEERGKAILEEERKADEERAAQEKEETDRKEAEAAKAKPAADTGKSKNPPPLIPLSQEDASIYMQLADPRLFKGKTVKVGDVEIDMGAYVEANPEVAIVSGVLIQNFLMQALHAGIIPSMESIREELSKSITGETGPVKGTIDEMRNALLVMDIKIQGVPDPEGLTRHEKFKPWLDKQKPEVKALFRSNLPSDHAKALKRFMREMNLPGVEKKQAIDAKAREAKDRKDKIFGTTFKPTPAATLKGTTGKAGATDDQDADYRDGIEEGLKKYGSRA